ncbi:MAG: hypothetical protein SFV55_09855 [Haliscomenobacter sp.]|uniref:hypothetical protein n=1 Tax=Haliscomenobacter sp. TaxID=2717303 RepID=UPI0029A33EE5|nr:hypothetical protein [Haliscomenobacter sp.]MDX2068720.1 hypothetical protein [Haliscomenobacter sp.]
MIYKLLLCALVSLVLSTEIAAQSKSNGQGPPPWAPAHGFRAKTRHVYFPEYNFYFDIEKRVYIHFQAGKWTVTVDLPARLGNINLLNASKFELDIDIDNPQIYNSEHQIRFRPKYAVADASAPVKVHPTKAVHPGNGHGKKK